MNASSPHEPNTRGPTGVGLGLRWEFIDDLVTMVAEGAALPFDVLEISPENYMRRGGYFPAALSYLADRFPILTHGLTMSLGGTDPLDEAYLKELRDFIAGVRSPWHSDHLCFSSVGGAMLHDLLPIAFTDAAAARVADRVRRAQDALGVPMAVENISYYMHPGRGEMSEPEFLTLVCERADCGLMLDVNNAYVNAQNFGFDADEWMRKAPLERTVQMHVAGHERFDEAELGAGATGSILIDTHGADVSDPVLALFARVLGRTGRVPVILERDQNIPPLPELLAELGRIRAIYERTVGSWATPG